MNEVARGFWSRMEAAEQKLSLLSEEDSRTSVRPGGWSRKQILGHLVDSACINHVRIAFAATQGHFEGPVYDQDKWVALNAYATVPWSAILDQWRARYTWMAEMVTNLPSSCLGATVTLGDHAPVSLEAWILDCLDHLEHHVQQITTNSPES